MRYIILLVILLSGCASPYLECLGHPHAEVKSRVDPTYNNDVWYPELNLCYDRKTGVTYIVPSLEK